MNIVAFQPEQAMMLSSFLVPWLPEDPDRNEFWYFGAADPEVGLLGMIAVDPLPEEAVLKSLAVLPSARRAGVGRELMAYVCRQLREQKVARLVADWEGEQEDWTALEPFFQSCGLACLSRSPLYRVPLGELLHHPLYSRLAAHPHLELKSLEQLPGFARREAARCAGIDADWLRDADPACSWVWQEGETVSCLVLMAPPQKGKMLNQWTWLSSRADNPATLPLTLAKVVESAAGRYPPETLLDFTAVSSSGEAILKKLLPAGDTGEELRHYSLSLEPVALKPPAMPEKRERSPEERQARMEEFRPQLMDAGMLGCAGCRYAGARLTVCARHPDGKPGTVFYGKPCREFEPRSE